MSGATAGLPVSPEGGGGFGSYRGERTAASHTESGLIDVLGTTFGTEHGVSFLLLFFHTLRLGPRQPNLLRNMPRRRKFLCERVARPRSRRTPLTLSKFSASSMYSHRIRHSTCKFLSRTEKNLQPCRLWKGRDRPARRAARPIPEIWWPPLSRDLRFARTRDKRLHLEHLSDHCRSRHIYSSSVTAITLRT